MFRITWQSPWVTGGRKIIYLLPNGDGWNGKTILPLCKEALSAFMLIFLTNSLMQEKMQPYQAYSIMEFTNWWMIWRLRNGPVQTKLTVWRDFVMV
jgi:hypothetical protein